MLSEILDISLIADFISFLKKKIYRFREKIKYSKSPREYLRKNIQALYAAIKNKDKKNAYDSFGRLADRFKIKYNSPEIFDGDVGWDTLSESFLEILRKYKELSSVERIMSFEEINILEKDVADILKQSYELDDEANCLSCGTKIPLNERRCPKCGWSWSP